MLALSWIRERQHRHADAVTYARQADAPYRHTGDRLGQARAANLIGWLGAQIGDSNAVDSCRPAVVTHQEVGDRYGEAAGWDSLGYAHHCLGEADEARTCYLQALSLHRAVGHRYDEAYARPHRRGARRHRRGAPRRRNLAGSPGHPHRTRPPDAEALRIRLQTGAGQTRRVP